MISSIHVRYEKFLYPTGSDPTGFLFLGNDLTPVDWINTRVLAQSNLLG